MKNPRTLSPRTIAAVALAHRRTQFEDLDAPDALEALVTQIETEGWLATLEVEDGTPTLADVLVELREAYTANRPNATTEESVEALTRVAAAIEAVLGEQTVRDDAAQALEDRLAEQDARVAAALGETEDPDADPAADPEADPATGRQAASSSGRRAPARRAPASLSSLSGNRSRRSTPDEGGAADDVDVITRITAGSAVGRIDGDVAVGQAFKDRKQFGQTVKALHESVRVHNPGQAKHYAGRTPVSLAGRIIDVDALADKGMSGDGCVDASVKALLAYRGKQLETNKRQIASGGICAPAVPDFTVTLIGETGTPFVSGLPTLASSRLIQFYPNVEVNMSSSAARKAGLTPEVDAFDATGHVTEAEDAAGYASQDGDGTTPDKDCLHIPCLPHKTTTLGATYKCVTVGNFMAKGFDEWVQVFDKYTQIGFDDKRERLAMQAVLNDPNAKICPNVTEFGAALDLLGAIRRLTESIRQTRRSPGLSIDVFLPDFASDILAQDLTAELFRDTTSKITDDQARAILAIDNVHVNTYIAGGFGTTTGGSPTVLPEQLAGPLNAWPAEIRVGVWPTGSVFHVQAWELAFGLREVGMKTNDASTFMELAETTETRSKDLFFIDQAVCVAGVKGGSVVLECVTDGAGS